MASRVQEYRSSFRNGLRTAASICRSFAMLAIVALAYTSTASAGEFKTYDMMGFSYVPSQHRDKGLEKVPVLYMCAMWKEEWVRHEVYCNDVDFSVLNPDAIRYWATQMQGQPVVAIDIEGGVWDLTNQSDSIVQGAVTNWQKLIEIWQEVNSTTKILIYGGVPRVVWEMELNNQASMDAMQAKETQAREIIAQLFAESELYDYDPHLVGLWPAAYIWYDKPNFFRAERKWQINICKSVYKTTCYFAIKPHYSAYYDANGFELHMDQNSFLEIMNTLKEDGADGFGLWISPAHLPEDYEYNMKAWSWQGGATGVNRDKNLLWMSAVERFLDAHIAIDPSASAADYCIYSLVTTAEAVCPAKVSRRLEKWRWLNWNVKKQESLNQ